jgi:hypothetical protein
LNACTILIPFASHDDLRLVFSFLVQKLLSQNISQKQKTLCLSTLEQLCDSPYEGVMYDELTKVALETNLIPTVVDLFPLYFDSIQIILKSLLVFNEDISLIPLEPKILKAYGAAAPRRGDDEDSFSIYFSRLSKFLFSNGVDHQMLSDSGFWNTIFHKKVNSCSPTFWHTLPEVLEMSSQYEYAEFSKHLRKTLMVLNETEQKRCLEFLQIEVLVKVKQYKIERDP